MKQQSDFELSDFPKSTISPTSKEVESRKATSVLKGRSPKGNKSRKLKTAHSNEQNELQRDIFNNSKVKRAKAPMKGNILKQVNFDKVK